MIAAPVMTIADTVPTTVDLATTTAGTAMSPSEGKNPARRLRFVSGIVSPRTPLVPPIDFLIRAVARDDIRFAANTGGQAACILFEVRGFQTECDDNNL